MVFKAAFFFVSVLFIQVLILVRVIMLFSCSLSLDRTVVVSTYQAAARGAISGGSSSVSNNGGSLIVTSVGPVVPSGISVASALDLYGELAVSGGLPFLSAVAFDGQFPTSGSGSVSYGCGDGTIAITQETGNPYGNNAASGGLTASQLGGCGCGKRY
ncbi:hypothetical protein MSG28_014981 [Choristoneura fumiferana]|uniref:Uncharacterized protein n=1 Tax=Choristoneura fumiferana TaxID=7141 RepID=A0ACC0KXT6_CHOFU|nr:hypothetical protein MSG28_014981 [Choristoneura fumiferana]